MLLKKIGVQQSNRRNQRLESKLAHPMLAFLSKDK
jgi:hypothetical protein